MLFWKKKTPEEKRMEEIIHLLKESNIDKRFSAISSLVELESSSIQTLLVLLENKNVRVRTSAAFAISRMISKYPELRKQLIEQVVEVLTHEDLRMQFYAAGLLGRIATNYPELLKTSIPRIISLLKENVSVSSVALRQIGLSAPQLVENLLPELIELSLEKHNFDAITPISIKHPQLLENSINQLMEFIKKTDKNSQSSGINAANILIRISKSNPELEQLIWNYAERLMKENNGQAKVFASYLIGEIGLKRPEIAIDILLPELEKSREEWSKSYCYHQILAVGRISSKSSVLAEKVKPKLMELKKKPWPIFRGFVAVSLIYTLLASPEFTQKISTKIPDSLKEKHPKKRTIAAISLKLLSNLPLSVISDALSGLADSILEENPKSRFGAGTGLWIISSNYEHDIDKPLISLIVELLRDKQADIKRQTLFAIDNIAQICPEDVKDFIPEIVELLKDKDESVRILAAAVLGDFTLNYPELIKEQAFSTLIELLDINRSAMYALSRLV